MDYEQICQPRWFKEHADLAWGFWARCHEAYTHAAPHAGYELLCSWGMRVAGLRCASCRLRARHAAR